MELKIVSFKVAKAIKEAGYDVICDYGYCVTDGIPYLVKTEEEWERHAINNSDMQDFLACTCQQVEGKDDCTAPTYLEVWLWLLREKDLIIEHITDGTVYINISNDKAVQLEEGYFDPEEAIINTIEYLVEHKLLK